MYVWTYVSVICSRTFHISTHFDCVKFFKSQSVHISDEKLHDCAKYPVHAKVFIFYISTPLLHHYIIVERLNRQILPFIRTVFN